MKVKMITDFISFFQVIIKDKDKIIYCFIAFLYILLFLY